MTPDHAKTAEAALNLSELLNNIRKSRRRVPFRYLAELVQPEMHGLSSDTLKLLAMGISYQYDEYWSTQLWNWGTSNFIQFTVLLEKAAADQAVRKGCARYNRDAIAIYVDKVRHLALHEQVELIVKSRMDYWEEYDAQNPG